MNIYKGIEIRREDNYYVTSGLNTIVNKELKIILKQRNNDEYIQAMHYIIDFILLTNPVITSNQTIAYYSWILKVIETNELYFSIWEAEISGNEYCEGIDYAIRVINDQTNQCVKHATSPIFPLFNQNIVISKGVYEGLAIDAVRYPSPKHMTGWWLTTELYDDNINSLMNVHYYHVAFKRPEILKYLALPPGYRFFAGKTEETIWLDTKVLE